MKSLLGGKGANLAEMKKIGLPVPNGFTVTTEACMAYFDAEQNLTDDMLKAIDDYLLALEEKTGKQLGGDNPLLVSVRSGAAISMPGMMDTILNLGLNDDTVERLSDLSDPVFAFDAYRRFIQMFSDVVLGIEKYKFDKIFNKFKVKDITALRSICTEYLTMVKKESKMAFPQSPKEQLILAVEAVFKSWLNHRAVIYRKLNDIPDDIGTAVNIQEMVFGNTGNRSGTGVAFTRNPSTGTSELYGEYLLNAQGEDVVAGIRTPEPIDHLKASMPDAYEQFVEVASILENHYKDMQDIEFTIENEKLFLLQTRTGKRTAQAAVEIAVDLVKEGVITKDEAIMRVDPEQINQLLHPTFCEKSLEEGVLLAKGLPASPGAASGKIYFDSEGVKEAVAKGEKAILVRTETSPEDIEGMVHAEGILTARGGMTSHAAVVARGMGKCCVAGCPEVTVFETAGYMVVNHKRLKAGDIISLDGSTGQVYEGEVKRADAKLSKGFDQLMTWADEKRKLVIRTNADTVRDASTAIKFGAEGIGLCRTEHMFFEPERITQMRQLILADSDHLRVAALETLLPYQENDFYELFKLLGERPMTIRLLDPPLHEFLPHTVEEIKQLSEALSISEKHIHERTQKLSEVNPMLGHRGCRLGMTQPGIYEMQVKAIFNAVCRLHEEGILITPEIMIPLVGFEQEIGLMKKLVINTADQVLESNEVTCNYKVGTMIEVPRAALVADEISSHADFFSFGTNDLTQMTLGFSRDDSNKFLGSYERQGVFSKDPFQSVDQNGVGKLMKLAVELGRMTQPDLKIGICGEHGGDPKSIAFCHQIGLDYVSCSPYRVPIARLAAAQAAINKKI